MRRFAPVVAGHRWWAAQSRLVRLLAALGLLAFAALAPLGLSPYWQGVLFFPVGVYVLLALGLNIVVGFAGLLDLGYVAFFAIGAYMYGLMASPHLSEAFPWFKAMFPNGLHTSI